MDGSGKTTQSKLLTDYCRQSGLQVLSTREPGGTRLSEKIRQAILDPKTKEIAGTTEALLYASSRAQHVSEIIKPALQEGCFVLCDRFMDSSIAYQGYGRCLGDEVRMINEFAVQGIVPDLTFFIDVDPLDGISRLRKIGTLDRIETEAIDFHERVYAGYMKIIEQDSSRFLIVDGNKTIDALAEDIRALFAEWLALKHGV